jgi:hypothetical protein
MRGLAFPPNADIDRETSHEYGTPISNVDDIPIDPALEGTFIDPILISEGGGINGVKVGVLETLFQRDASCSIIGTRF